MLLRRYAYGSDWKCSYSFFGILNFPSNTLQQIRKRKYNGMVAADCLKIDPALLLSSPPEVFYHGLRVYH